jgi:hypothetical protein
VEGGKVGWVEIPDLHDDRLVLCMKIHTDTAAAGCSSYKVPSDMRSQLSCSAAL